MDYKEKYNKLVEAVKALQEANPSDGGIRNWVNDNVPELKESEDEKIREKLIEYFKDLMCGWFPYSNEEIIAYLEKLKDYDKQLEVQYKRGYGKGYADGMVAAKKKELEKQNEKPTTISVDKMVGEFEDFKVISCGRIPSLAELDAYRKGVNDALSKILIKEEKPITIGSKKAEGKLGEMIAASKEPAESGEDKELSRKQVTKKSDKVKWSDEDQGFFGLLEGYLEFDYTLSMNDKANTLDWLKSIKERIQPKWSKEDEAGFGDTLWAINKARTIAKDENDMGNLWYAENWLKGIKERMQ